MTKEADEFIQSIDGEMTAEQAAQLLELSMGDTEQSDSGGEPSTSREQEGDAPVDGADADDEEETPSEEEEQQAGEEGEELDPANAVVLAKDGKHTIPYERLVEAREAEQASRAALEAANQELEQLRAEARARAEAGEAPTATDAQIDIAQEAIDSGEDPDLFGDFSEEALKAGIQKLIDAKVAEKLSHVEQTLAPVQQRHAQEAAKSHYDAIYQAHPDADSMAESQELSDWINAQPSFVRDNYNAVLQQGSTEQVIELFDSFKSATGGTSDAQQAEAKGKDAEAIKAAAKAKLAGKKPSVPNSLSDIPAGRTATASRIEAMADMTGTDLLDEMDDMTPEQIEQFLNSTI